MIIEFENLKNIRAKHADKKIIICSGWFDLFHTGHLNFLKKAKDNGDILVVLVMNDTDGNYIKGVNRPIINQFQRGEIIDSLKCVDYTIISGLITNDKISPSYFNSVENKKTKMLWDRYLPIIGELNADKVFALKETLKFNGLEKCIEELKCEVVYCDRCEGISTTDIVKKLHKHNKTNKLSEDIYGK